MRKRVLYSILLIASVIAISLVLKNTVFNKEIEKSTSLSQVSAAAGTEEEEEVIHTHIWATKYDKTKHWEYCTVCDRIRNEEEHNCEDNWFLGHESCHYENYSTRICKCGYNYTYYKPHSELCEWRNTGVRMVHYRSCTSCWTWRQSGHCYDDDGILGCQNPGTCKVCGITATKDWHYIIGTQDIKGTRYGKCRDCNKIFFRITPFTITYAEDYSTATIKFSFIPMDDSVELTGQMGAYCPNVSYSSNKWTYVKHEDGSCDYTGVYTFNPDRQKKSDLCFLDRTGAIKINGQSLYMDGNILRMRIWQDHYTPSVMEIKQVDQATSRDWATIKELTISGQEGLAKIVTISIKDKLTKEVIIDRAKVNVIDGKYEYQCTPPIEGPVEGRDYVLTVTDEVGNVKEQVFTIYRTDSRAPMLKNNDFTEWSKTKTIDMNIADYGSGYVQTSLDNQYSYIPTTYADGYYHGKYTFAEENYGIDEHVVYLRDDLGNARREWIKVGKIDNTKPTIKDMSVNEGTDAVDISLTGDDYSAAMKAQGSGVAYYAMTQTTAEDPTSWSTSNTLRITKPGVYYVWLKDRAGNISDARRVVIGPDFEPRIEDEVIPGGVILHGEREMSRYYLYDEKMKLKLYVGDNSVSFMLFGEKNNDEQMYIYLSNTEDTIIPTNKLPSYTFDSEDLVNTLSASPNILDLGVTNTREVSRYDNVYLVEANNLCTVSLPKNIDDIIDDKSSMPVYVHIISQYMNERVIDLNVMRRVIFEEE